MDPPKKEINPPTRLLLAGFIIISTVVGRTFTALNPHLSPDGQMFAYVGQQWVQGRVPYVQIWDLKPPGIFALVALVFRFFPGSFTALAFVEGTFILATVATVYFFMRRCGAALPAALLATLAAAIACNLKDFNAYGTLTEIYLLCPATLSMYFFVRAGRQFEGKWVFLAGVMAGGAALFKPVGLSPFLAQGAFLILLVLGRKIHPVTFARLVIISSAGLVAAWVPFMVYFAAHHALGAMLDASILAPVMYATGGHHSFLFTVNYLASNLQPLSSLIVCAAVGVGLNLSSIAEGGLFRPIAEEETPSIEFWWPLVILWLFGDFCAVMAGGRGFNHYFLPLCSSLSVAAGFAYWKLTDQIPKYPNGLALKVGMLAIILGPLLSAQSLDVRDFANMVARRESPPAPPWEKMADALNQRRRPTDTLFIWEYLPQIYYITGMRSPTRELFAFHIFESSAFYEKFGHHIIRELDDNPPTFIVNEPTDPWIPDFEERGGFVLKDFRQLLQSRYHLVFQVEGLNLYELAGAH